MKRVAVVCAQGIGDGLIMMVASHRLLNHGFAVTTFHDQLGDLSSWFENHHFENHPPLDELAKTFSEFDWVILQNDNTMRSRGLMELYRNGTLSSLSVLYPTYEEGKHPALTSWDRVFESSRPMVENVAHSIASLLHVNDHSKSNGISPPTTLTHRKYINRIIIHPTSTTPHRTWQREKFVSLGTELKNQGFDVHFAVGPHEYPEWNDLQNQGFRVPQFHSLSDLAAHIYEAGFLIGNESGLSHLASNLQLPTLVIAGNAKRIKLWRPGWLSGKVIVPSKWIPNFKKLRLRENKWQTFISPKNVLSSFRSIL